MRKKVSEEEIAYYDETIIKNNFPPSEVNINKLKHRVSNVFFEPFNKRPQDIFYINITGFKFVGRKLLSKLWIQGKINATKCSQITASMILGLLEREQITDKGIAIFFRPLTPAEKLFIFDLVSNNLKTDIYFPFPYLNENHKEHVAQSDYLNNLNQALDINNAEDHIRKFTIDFLSQFELDNKKIFDPACSTGKFLQDIKNQFPKVHTIGQASNEEVVKYAKNRVDEIFHSDPLHSKIKEESVDFVFLRFLNLEVVSTLQAHELFTFIGNRCKNGGLIILSGHTPVLISSEWCEVLGLKVLQRIGYSEENNSVFQYYVLLKTKPIPRLTFENFSLFNKQSRLIRLKDRMNNNQCILTTFFNRITGNIKDNDLDPSYQSEIKAKL